MCFMKRNICTIVSVLLLCCMLFACGTPAPEPAPEPTGAPSVSAAETEVTAEAAATQASAEPSAPEPTPASTVLPTPKPTVVPVSDEELNSGALDSFFDDSVLIGDSMTVGFSHFVSAKRKNGGVCLGSLKCIGRSGLFLKNAYQIEIGTRSAALSYRGRAYSVSDLVQVIGAKTLYLLLGVNDVYVYNNTVEDDISYFDEIIRNTREKSPDVQIVLITIPPVLKTYAKDFAYDSRYNIDVNEALYRYCRENGFGIVELAARLRGEDGYLNRSYCSDDQFHLNLEGDALWLAALREYARTQYESGAWIPEETPES